MLSELTLSHSKGVKMRAYEIIAKKRDNFPLSYEEINFMIQGFVEGKIPDYQMAAFLMAVFIRGLSLEELVNLTSSMVSSGKTIDLTLVKGVKVDKHSTGGIGDKTTLVVAPLVASCGLKVAKLTGRALGHTGGTIDKLHSIPGLRTDLSTEEFINQVNQIGIALSEATEDIAPADKKIYSLRDLTATVSSIPLIASSVMSKKIAGGADKIVIDVKCGSGAFMKSLEEAEELAQILVLIGKKMERETHALITNMDEPLGKGVGNALEVKEAIETLKGKGPPDLTQLSLQIASEMLILGGIASNQEEAQDILTQNIITGKAIKKLEEMIKFQNGDPEVVKFPEKLPTASLISEFPASEEGYLTTIDAEKVGWIVHDLGAGRKKKEDKIDYSVGLVFHKKVGDYLKKGDLIAEIHANTYESLDLADTRLGEAIVISSHKPAPKPLVYKIIK